MAIQIKLKNSVVQDSTPSTSDLPAVGEIALNANINSIGGFMRASDNSIVKIFGPGSLSTPTATTTVSGISELATNSETTTGTATNRVVTPAGLNAVTVAERSTSNSTYLALAGGTLTGVVAATAGSNSAPSIHFGDSDSGIFGGTNTVGLTAGGTTGLSVFETNVRVPTKLGINGAVPQTPLDVIANASGYAMAVRGRSADDLSQIRFTSNDYGTIFAELESDATYLATRIGGSEKLRVDSSGRLLIGASSSVPIATNLGLSLQVLGTGFADSSTLLGRFSADTLAPCINFAKSRNATIGSNTIVQDDDELGKIRFYGSDGVDLANYGAEIIASVDGTPGSDDMPGRLVFATTADGASSPTERLRIDSSGNVGIGTTSPAQILHLNKSSGDTYLRLQGGTNQGTLIHATDGTLLGGFVSGGAVGGGASDIAMRVESGNNMLFAHGTTERMRIDSSGNVGIGTSSPLSKLNIVDGSDNDAILFVQGADTTSEYVSLGVQTGKAIVRGGGSGSTNTALAFEYSNAGTETEGMRITSTGRVGLGTTSPDSRLHLSYDSGDSQIRLTRSNAAANTNDYGRLLWESQDDVLTGKIAVARESAENDGYMHFSTASGGTLAERMRIDSSGNIGIGTSSPSEKLDVEGTIECLNELRSKTGNDLKLNAGSANRDIFLQVNDSTLMTVQGSSGNVGIGTSTITDDSEHCKLVISGSTGTAAGILIFQDTSNNEDGMIFANDGSLVIAADRSNATAGSTLQFRVDGSSEKMRIDSSGNVYFGVTSTPNGSSVGGSAFIAEDNNREVLYLATTGGTETLVRFHNSNGQVGVISVSGSSTSYVTSSDYRLKENATAISDGITRLKTLKPYRFNWKADASTTVDGFFAHEVTAVPEAITGTKDEVDSDNNPVYQGIDQSKLVPLLVAAVQELIGKVEALEAA